MPTYKPIQSTTLSSAASTITFSGIDQGYTDLVLVGNPTVSASLDYKWYVNGDNTNGLYSSVQIRGNGSGSTSVVVSNANYTYLNGTAPASGTSQVFTMNLQNYSNTTTYKTVLVRYSEAGSETNARVSVWRNTSPITSITISTDTSTFAAGSTFSLYGIKSGAPSALGGDIVATDGTYWYHAFLSTGSFTPLKTLTADCLLVGGGAGGGYSQGGGGGAGGFVTASNQTFSTGIAYTATVGSGGAGATSSQSYGANGGNTSLSSITAYGGGGGGTGNVNGQNGASGGGGGGGGGTFIGGTATPAGQGNKGGDAYNGGNYGGGGGGGAGAAGSNGQSSAGGAGGIGTYTTLTDSLSAAVGTGVSSSGHYYYAGGGGGSTFTGGTYGVGGTGGGGRGGNYASGEAGVAGTANTGGGGGASGYGPSFPGSAGPGGAGGSGIIIVRYAV
jgi:hypothetical protein